MNGAGNALGAQHPCRRRHGAIERNMYRSKRAARENTFFHYSPNTIGGADFLQRHPQTNVILKLLIARNSQRRKEDAIKTRLNY